MLWDIVNVYSLMYKTIVPDKPNRRHPRAVVTNTDFSDRCDTKSRVTWTLNIQRVMHTDDIGRSQTERTNKNQDETRLTQFSCLVVKSHDRCAHDIYRVCWLRPTSYMHYWRSTRDRKQQALYRTQCYFDDGSFHVR
jgi:hypothetical protein